MPVIINEFEVVVEPPSPEATSSTPPSAPSQIIPKDLERLIEHLKQRRARLHAD